MMDLSLLFDPVGDHFKQLVEAEPNFGQSVYQYFHKVPEIEGMHLAFIGIQENRGTSTKSTGYSEAADKIRKKLYTLQRGSGTYKIADLGNLRNGPTLEDTLQRVQEVCAYLMTQDVVPILFGGSHDITLAQVEAYRDHSEKINLLVADCRFDLNDSSPDVSHLRQIIRKSTDLIFQMTHIGHQSYLVSEEMFGLMESQHFDAIRVGLVKEKLKEMEPLIRDADTLSFDFSALSQLYAPGTENANPYGLTGEEACQICWYAGLNDKLTSAGFYGMDSDLDDQSGTTAFVAATMIWYFIDGFYHRTNEKDFHSQNFMIYEVSLSGEPSSIRFFKSKRSEKWWMEVPNTEHENSVFLRNKMVPCSYEDYQSALSGEVPSRWLSAFARLN